MAISRAPKAAARVAIASPMWPYPRMPMVAFETCRCSERLHVLPGGPLFRVQLLISASIWRSRHPLKNARNDVLAMGTLDWWVFATVIVGGILPNPTPHSP